MRRNCHVPLEYDIEGHRVSNIRPSTEFIWANSSREWFSVAQAAGQTWKSMLDHGKWSVSVQQQPASSVLPDVACHSDLNHMYSQTYRGGGALCFELTGLWATLSKTISSVEPCIVSHQNAGGLGSDVASRDCA